MGSAMQSLDRAATGIAGGMQQGMNLYSQYSELQARNKDRQTKTEIEEQIGALSKEGKLNDTIEGPKAIANLYFQHGLAEEGSKYLAHAESATKAKGDKLALSAYQLAAVDPFSAAGKLNEYAEVMGLGTKFNAVRTPNGFQIDYQGPDGKTSKQYTSPEEFHHDTMEFLLPYLEGPGKKRETDAEVAKNSAMAENYRSDASARAALLPSQIAENTAQATSALASASNSSASAAATREEAPARRALLGAQTGAAERSNQPDTDTGALLKGAGITDSDPLTGGAAAPDRDKVRLFPLVEGLKAGGRDPAAATSLALRLAGMPGAAINTKAGIVREADGTEHDVGVDVARQLRDLRAAKDAAGTLE